MKGSPRACGGGDGTSFPLISVTYGQMVFPFWLSFVRPFIQISIRYGRSNKNWWQRIWWLLVVGSWLVPMRRCISYLFISLLMHFKKSRPVRITCPSVPFCTDKKSEATWVLAWTLLHKKEKVIRRRPSNLRWDQRKRVHCEGILLILLSHHLPLSSLKERAKRRREDEDMRKRKKKM